MILPIQQNFFLNDHISGSVFIPLYCVVCGVDVMDYRGYKVNIIGPLCKKHFENTPFGYDKEMLNFPDTILEDA